MDIQLVTHSEVVQKKEVQLEFLLGFQVNIQLESQLVFQLDIFNGANMYKLSKMILK